MPWYRSLRVSIARLTADMREGLWTTRTWKQMESLWTRLHAYAAQRALPISDQTATLFVHDLDVAPTTKVGYANQLANLFRKMGLPSEVLRTYAQSQRGLGGARPANLAPPIPRAALVAIAEAQPDRLRVAMLLAWKTASRWDDIARVTKRSLLSVREDQIIVDFGSATKTSRARPFRPEMPVVVLRGGSHRYHHRRVPASPAPQSTAVERRTFVPIRDERDPRTPAAGRLQGAQYQAGSLDSHHKADGRHGHSLAPGGGAGTARGEHGEHRPRGAPPPAGRARGGAADRHRECDAAVIARQPWEVPWRPQVPPVPRMTAATPWGAVCDLTCSFLQVHRPQRFRKLFFLFRGLVWPRVADARALPMGSSLSHRELMHTLVSVIDGDPDFFAPDWGGERCCDRRVDRQPAVDRRAAGRRRLPCSF
ncbi:hypothetical protein NESM_000486000 [Novymonas esmeraldas]|uniref:Tyr recombinase domain-containing protein n=1 Tax=Novymonas esmeraldas TaxID=1808958 RepID=A0AAW0EQB7_9TRYP